MGFYPGIVSAGWRPKKQSEYSRHELIAGTDWQW
jgi:hypothetical protein